MIKPEEVILVQGKANYTTEIIFSLIVVCGAWVLAYTYATLNPEILFINYFFASFFALPSLRFLFYLFSLKFVSISQDNLILKYLFWQKTVYIPLNQLLYWTERTYESKRRNHYKLRIYTQTQKIELQSLHFENYTELKNFLIKDIYRNVDLEKKQEKRRTRIAASIWLIICSFLLYQAYVYQFIMPRGFTNKDLYIIRDVVQEIDYHPAAYKSNPRLYLSLQKRNAFKYLLVGNAYHATYVGWFLETVQIGDSVSVFVAKKEYTRQLEKLLKPLKNSSKFTYWNNNVVHIYGLNAGSNEYLIREDFNRDEKIEVILIAWILTLVVIIGVPMSLAFLINPDWATTDSTPDHQISSHSNSE